MSDIKAKTATNPQGLPYDTKPREFWIRHVVTPEGGSASSIHDGPLPVKSEIIHVIEYSAFEQLRAERDEAKEKSDYFKHQWMDARDRAKYFENQLTEADKEYNFLYDGSLEKKLVGELETTKKNSDLWRQGCDDTAKLRSQLAVAREALELIANEETYSPDYAKPHEQAREALKQLTEMETK